MADDLIIEALRVEAQGTRLIDDISARFAPGQLTAIVGPNGAGKSTLLRAIAGVVPAQGAIRMGTADVTALRPAERARRLAYLPQVHELAWDISVADMVALGRFADGAAPGRLSAEDKAAVDRAMAATGCTDLAHRGVTSLSGGEAALACLARVLAAETPVLLVDEPVAALDPANQYRVMECLAALAAGGRTVVAVLHDLSLVAQFASSILWIHEARLIAHGPATRAAFETQVPALFNRQPGFSTDGSNLLYFKRERRS
ncbi:MAG: ABC transporter ATP-binding protein [Sphingopyxis terrae]|uniref:ABC transporter ATP-binding protein n=1 Tax=Sphingopyxis terrae TaxID=33052 RepID=UPI003F8191F5